jgi:hypothetical protein
MTTAKKIEATSPAELAEKIWNELGTDADRVEFMNSWERLASARLDELAVSVRNPAIPGGWYRMSWLTRSGGHSLAAYALAAAERRT